MRRIREGLASGKEFVVTCELVPGRGFTGVGIDNILKFAEEARGSNIVYGMSITDNAGGNPALWADVLGPEIRTIGCDLMVHFSCKDMNRNMIEARAYALKRAGITNLLVLTGDYPVTGFFGQPKPVFDIDAVTALHYLHEMNRGLEVGTGGKSVRLEATDFLLGAVASPFKATEASAVMQYIKLEKKIRAGANFLVSQLGYDARKAAEFIRYVRQVIKLGHPRDGQRVRAVRRRGAVHEPRRGARLLRDRPPGGNPPGGSQGARQGQGRPPGAGRPPGGHHAGAGVQRRPHRGAEPQVRRRGRDHAARGGHRRQLARPRRGVRLHAREQLLRVRGRGALRLREERPARSRCGRPAARASAAPCSGACASCTSWCSSKAPPAIA